MLSTISIVDRPLLIFFLRFKLVEELTSLTLNVLYCSASGAVCSSESMVLLCERILLLFYMALLAIVDDFFRAKGCWPAIACLLFSSDMI